MDGDHYPELLVAGDFGTNKYYRNNKDGTFSELDPGTGQPVIPSSREWTINNAHNGMGTTIGDFNGDGLPDWFVTAIWPAFVFESDYWGNGLYINQGNHTYTEHSGSAGVNDGGWGWGTVANDFDNDGHTDLVMTNGWPTADPITGETFVNERAYLWLNNGDTTFEETGALSHFNHTGQGRTLLTLDYDLDGDMDVVILSNSERIKLLRNDLIGGKRRFLHTNWIQIVLDTNGNDALPPHGVGAVITVENGQLKQTQQVFTGGTFLGQSELVAHFGLGKKRRVRITVDWGNGRTTRLRGTLANQRITIKAPG